MVYRQEDVSIVLFEKVSMERRLLQYLSVDEVWNDQVCLCYLSLNDQVESLSRWTMTT